VAAEGEKHDFDSAAEQFAIARTEEELRARLGLEQARSAALERDLETLRSSEAFRIGHALVEGVQARLRWNVLGMIHATGERLRRGRPARGVDARPQARGGQAHRGSVTMFVAWGVQESRLEDYASRVERLQAVLVEFRPLFVVDSLEAEPVRRRGYPIEYLVPLTEWSEHRPAHEWGPYVTQRMAEVQRRHQPGAVVILEGASAPSALDQGLLNPILLPSIGEGDDNQL
jgi:hypothetical protein